MTLTTGLGITLVEARQTQPHLVINEALNVIDKTVSGRLPIDMGGLATLTLSNANSSYFILNPFGTPSGNFNLTVNGTTKAYLIINDTAFICSFGAATGSRQSVYPGKALHCYFDGTNMHPITPNDSGWLNLALATGWSNTGGDWAALSYRKLGDIVYLRGQVGTTTGTTDRLIATLPASFRPSVKKQIAAISSTPAASQIVHIATNGEVTYQGSDSTISRLSFDSFI